MDLDSVLNALANTLRAYSDHRVFYTSEKVPGTVASLKHLALKTVNIFSIVGDPGTRNAYLAAIKRGDREAILSVYSDLMVTLDLTSTEYNQLTTRLSLGAHVHYRVTSSHDLDLPHTSVAVANGFYESPTLLVIGLMATLGHQHWDHIEVNHAEVRK